MKIVKSIKEKPTVSSKEASLKKTSPSIRVMHTVTDFEIQDSRNSRGFSVWYRLFAGVLSVIFLLQPIANSLPNGESFDFAKQPNDKNYAQNRRD